MTRLTLDQVLQQALGHHQAGRFHEAEMIYRQILAQQPKHADALHLLGVIALQVGQFNDAIDLIRRAISIQPNIAVYHNNLGNALHSKGELDQAIVAYRQAVRLKPIDPETQNNLGNALRDKGLLDESISACREAIRLKPNYAEAYNNLGNALYDQKQLDEAIINFRKAIGLRPDYAQAHSNLGNTLREKGQIDAAVAACRQAVRLNPNLAEAYYNLGNGLKDKAQLDEAITAYRQALSLRPNYADVYGNLAGALMDTGQLDDSIAAYRQAITLRPDYIGIHSNLVLTLHYHPAYDAQAIAQEQHNWNQRHAEPSRKFIQPHFNDRNPDRRLRIGYVSADFWKHPVGRFLLPLLERHDHQQFEIFCYSNGRNSDEITTHLRSHSDHWREIINLNDERASAQIRADGIDILVDLSGHTAHNRLLLFARKLAPVQVSYLGYLGAAGLSAIDYHMTDRYLDLHEADNKFYSEKSIRLEGSYWCYRQSDIASPVNELPALGAGKITFGCLNNYCKVNRITLETWATILLQLPNSRLLLSCPAGNHRDRLMRLMQDRGVAPDRIELVGGVSFDQYFETYRRMDIALDPFPYAGGTTTCDALWMGVPVVTLSGRTAVGRAGVSILNNAGLPELVATTTEHYVNLAVSLAKDLDRLKTLRLNLRQLMQASPLMDAPNFARSIEAAYRQIWRAWCVRSFIK